MSEYTINRECSLYEQSKANPWRNPLIAINDKRLFTPEEVLQGEAEELPTYVTFYGSELDPESNTETGFSWTVMIACKLDFNRDVSSSEVKIIWDWLQELDFSEAYVELDFSQVPKDGYGIRQHPSFNGKYESFDQIRKVYYDSWHSIIKWDDVEAIIFERTAAEISIIDESKVAKASGGYGAVSEAYVYPITAKYEWLKKMWKAVPSMFFPERHLEESVA